MGLGLGLGLGFGLGLGLGLGLGFGSGFGFGRGSGWTAAACCARYGEIFGDIREIYEGSGLPGERLGEPVSEESELGVCGRQLRLVVGWRGGVTAGGRVTVRGRGRAG